MRTTQTQRELGEFRVAVDQRRRTDDGRWEDAPAAWFRIRAMGNQLERAPPGRGRIPGSADGLQRARWWRLAAGRRTRPIG
jgi:Single-strand binding protein family